MGMKTYLTLFSLAFCVLAFVCQLEIMYPIVNNVLSKLPIINKLVTKCQLAHRSSGNTDFVFSKDELLKYKGTDNGDVYLAVLGRVFDVSKGRRHYGPGGGYEFFAGIDGSKAFVSGEFNEKGLTDDISTLTPSEATSLENWREFYEKDYKYLGKVEGAFYDKEGNELEMMKFFKKQLEAGILEKKLLEDDRQLFPPCNSEWSQDKGGRVWCSTLSGGVSRDWAGVPRRYFQAGSTKPRCACVRASGPPSHDLQKQKHNNHGDLDNPNLNLYPNCEPTSESCPLPKS